MLLVLLYTFVAMSLQGCDDNKGNCADQNPPVTDEATCKKFCENHAEGFHNFKAHKCRCAGDVKCEIP